MISESLRNNAIRYTVLFLLFSILWSVFQGQGFAASVNDGFDPNANGTVYAVATQPDGKIVIGGDFTMVAAVTRNRIARLNVDGSLDTGFQISVNGTVKSIALQPDGKIVIGGGFTMVGGFERNYIARLNADGTLDSNFDPNTSGSVYTIVLQPDGKIIIGGAFTFLNDYLYMRYNVARLSTDGNVDTTFANPAVSSYVNSIALQPDGKIVVGGDFATVGGTAQKRIARLNTDGSRDTTFLNPDVNSYVSSVTLQPDGKIVVGGNFTALVGMTRNYVARLAPDGSLDAAFNPSPDWTVNSLALQPDGKILIGGSFATIGGASRNKIARLNPEGSLDAGFDSNTNGAVSCIAVQPDGKILTGGSFTTVGSTTRNRVARLNVDGTPESTFNPNANNSVYSIALQPEGRIIIGGGFTSIGGTTRNYIARLNAGGSLDVGFDPNANFEIRCIALQSDGKIVIGGEFTAIGGVPRNHIARLNEDGSIDPAFNSDVNGSVYTLVLQSDGKLVIGGEFTAIGGVPRNHIARLANDGALDSDFDPNADGTVLSLALQPDGKILMGGTFTGVGSTTHSKAARLNADGSLDGSFGDPSVDHNVNTFALQPDGKILIGGAFGSVGGVVRNGAARLHPDGSLDETFGDPGSNADIYSIALQTDGKMIVGGQFSVIGGAPINGIARLNADGSLDAGFNPNASGTVLSVALQPDGKIILGGPFTAVGGATRNRIARLSPDYGTVQSLSIPQTSTVTWTRNGSGPAVYNVVFEQSTDGSAWTVLGTGTRVPGGWELTGNFSLVHDENLYVRVRGNTIGGQYNGSQGMVESIRRTFLDSTIPAGSISINSAAATTNSTIVSLGLSCIDFSGCARMAFSNNNADWAEYDYAPAKSWTLASGDGSKTVYAKFMDNSGNWSSVRSTFITLDTQGPTVTASPLGNAFVVPQNVTLTSSEAATIWYTIDGSDPSRVETRREYVNPIPITITTVLCFYAVDAAGNPGPLSSETYTIQDFSLAAGEIKIVRGETKQFPLSLTAIGGFSSSVALRAFFADSTPAGVGITLTPDTVTPAPEGTPVTIGVTTDAAAPSGPRTLRITGEGGGITRIIDIPFTVYNTMTLITDTLPPGVKGQAYLTLNIPPGTVTIQVSGGISPVLFTKTAGTLPDGVALNPDGTLVGNPSIRGSFTFTVRAQDAQGHTAQKDYTIRVYDTAYRQLVLEATSWTVERNATSGWITARVIDDYGNPLNVDTSTMISVASSSSTGRFTTDGTNFSPDNAISPSIPAGYSSVIFKYKDSASGTPDLTASGVPGTPSEAWASGSHSMTVTSPALMNASLTITSVTQGATYGQGVTVSGLLKDSTNSPFAGKTVSLTFTSPSGPLLTEYSAITASDGTFSYSAASQLIDRAGAWSVNVTFKSDPAYNPVSTSSPFSVAKADTSLILFLNASSISPTGTVTVSGKLSANTPSGVDLSNIPLTITFSDGSTSLTLTPSTYTATGQYQITSPANFFTSTGLWSATASLAPTVNFNGSTSSEKDLTVATSAGYAILIEGDANGQYRANYTASLDDIYAKLIKRSFIADNIYYLSSEDGWITHTGVDRPTTRDNIAYAFTTWAPQQIRTYGVAPLYVVLMNHGSPGGIFHIGTDTLTPSDLDGWLDAIENEFPGITPVIINGFCYSGSFISSDLSKPGRIIISSAASDQESAQGPSTASKVFGEYFVYYLFNNLVKGQTIQDAFKDAASVTHKLRECTGQACGTNATSKATNSRQTPMLDDNGDHVGSWMNLVGQEDKRAQLTAA